MLFCERAKLFRHVNGEFKERGIGELKILKHKKHTDTYRCLMRREVVKKLCANFTLAQRTLMFDDLFFKVPFHFSY